MPIKHSRKRKSRRKASKPLIATIKRVHNSMDKQKDIRMKASAQMYTDVVGDSFAKYELSAIPIGTTEANRLGDKCTITYLDIKFSLYNFSPFGKVARVMLLRENNKRGDVINVTAWDDLFRNEDATARFSDALSGDINAMINPELVRVLADYTINIPSHQEQKKFAFSFRKKLHEVLKFEYFNGSATLPTNGRLYWLIHIISPSNVAGGHVLGTDNMVFDSYARIRFRG